jgi:hypothetical protein
VISPTAVDPGNGVTSLAVQPSVGFHVADSGLNGRPSSLLAAHGGGETAPAAGDHHLARAGVAQAFDAHGSLSLVNTKATIKA